MSNPLKENEVISIYHQRCLQALHAAFVEAVEKNDGNWLVHIQGQFDIFASAIDQAAGSPRKRISYPESNTPSGVSIRVQDSLTEFNKNSVYPGEPPGFRQKDHHP